MGKVPRQPEVTKVACAGLVLFWLFIVGRVAAQMARATLAWNANSETNLAGYTLYWGTESRSYPSNAQIAAPATQFTVSNLSPATKYFFAVTARTDDGLESDYSAEVGHTPAGEPGPTNEVVTITVTFEEACDLAGPWEARTNMFTVVLPADATRFYRARLEAR